jgi:peroxiredoxin
LFIKPDITHDFIYSDKENATLHSEDEYIYAQNTHFHDSPENGFMESKYGEQMERMRKIMFLNQGMQLYKPEEKPYSFFREEKEKLEELQAAFETMLQQEAGNLYSARLMRLQNLINNYIARLEVTSDTAEHAQIRAHILQELDTETLYRSGMWFPVINGMLELYYKQSPFYSQFGEDMVTLLKRTKSQEVFLTLANDAATICNQYSWNTDEAALSKYLNQSGRVVNPQGKLAQMLTIYKLQPGMKAPALAGASLSNKELGTLIMFYETGCNSCDNEINQLIGNYPVLKEKGIKVITISSDNDKSIYENNSNRFPWKDKLCDFKGFTGENFKNYGVMGTPTIYLIDKNGRIQGKYASLADVEAIF